MMAPTVSRGDRADFLVIRCLCRNAGSFSPLQSSRWLSCVGLTSDEKKPSRAEKPRRRRLSTKLHVA